MSTLAYTSPGARSKWWALFDLGLTAWISVLVIVEVIAGRWLQAIFFALLLMSNTLFEIAREVRASRQLAEITLRVRFEKAGIR